MGIHTKGYDLSMEGNASASETRQGFDLESGTRVSVVSGLKKQGPEDLYLVKTENGVSGSSEKIGHGNAKVTLKHGWTKPPRPPRAATCPSRERLIKSISDADLLRRARLERIRSLRKHKVKQRPSTKTTLWALLFTVFFFGIVIIQGINSQGSVSPPDSSAKSGQTSSLLNKFSSDPSNIELRERVTLFLLESEKYYRAKTCCPR